MDLSPHLVTVHSSFGCLCFCSRKNTTITYTLCSSGDGGIASSFPSQASFASSSSLDLFDPLPISTSTTLNPIRKTPESFLGPNAALVNLDSLVTKPAQPPPVANPFLASAGRHWSIKLNMYMHTSTCSVHNEQANYYPKSTIQWFENCFCKW